MKCMKKKSLFLIILILSVVIIFILSIIIKNKQDYFKSDFIVDDQGKYIITTYEKLTTMKLDGGSYTNIYYQIDLNENQVIKCEDKYVGFKGYEYVGKILYSKQLSEAEEKELKSILDKIIINGEGTTNIKDSGTFEFYLEPYYILTMYNRKDIYIYSEVFIEKINRLLEK